MGKPEIRFKGYTDEWEQRKLGEVTQCLDSERVPINSEEREKIPGEIPYYGAGNIQGYINKFLFDEELVLLLEDGDAFDDFRTKEIAQYICGKTWVNNHAHVLRPLGDAYFLYITLSHKDIRNWVQLAGASRKKLVQKSMLNIELFMPHIIEQKKIGQYFSNLDHLITLHQRKCDEIKSLKKYMLQKMFPQNEQKVPKIRFKGFTEAWEQRKLGEKMYIKSRIGWQRLTKDEYQTEGDYYLITGTDIDEVTHTIDLNRSYYVSKERYEKDSNIQVIEGDIIVTKDGTIGKVAMVCGLDKPATFNSHLFVLRDLSGKLNNRFLLHILDSPIFEKFVEASKTGSTLTGLPQKTMVEFEFKVPSVEEQKMISCYFDILDHLITLHQQKCEELKKIKKFMLQKMFV